MDYLLLIGTFVDIQLINSDYFSATLLFIMVAIFLADLVLQIKSIFSNIF